MTAFPDANGKRLVAVMPHPDDESYSCAGTLALAAASGAEVMLVTATRGESGWVRDRELYGHLPIGELRTAELEASCAALGIGPPRVLGWPDGGVENLGDENRRIELGRALREFAPDVVITLAADGVYGHRDHVALTRTCIELAGEFRLLLADFPRGLFSDLARTFIEHAGQFLVDGVSPDSLGTDIEDVDLCVDISSVADRKRGAIASHDSQLETVEPLEFLFPGLVEAVSLHEWFVSAGGPALPEGSISPFAGLS